MNFPDLSDLIDAGYAAKPPMDWPTFEGGNLDRSLYMTSSEAGYCSRRIKFRQTSPQVPFTEWGYAERGNNIEAWAVNLIRVGISTDPNWELHFAGASQRSFSHKYQSGTPDGMLLNTATNEAVIVEIKSIDPRTNYAKLPKPGHVLQVHQNVHLVEKVFPEYTFLVGVILYIDASNYQRRSTKLVPRDVTVMLELRYKAEAIASKELPKELPAEGIYTG